MVSFLSHTNLGMSNSSCSLEVVGGENGDGMDGLGRKVEKGWSKPREGYILGNMVFFRYFRV